jgi:hypothetical protein
MSLLHKNFNKVHSCITDFKFITIHTYIQTYISAFQNIHKCATSTEYKTCQQSQTVTGHSHAFTNTNHEAL